MSMSYEQNLISRAKALQRDALRKDNLSVTAYAVPAPPPPVVCFADISPAGGIFQRGSQGGYKKEEGHDFGDF